MNARDEALYALDARPLPTWPARLLRPRPRHDSADPRDQALAEQIHIGVVKNLLLLTHLTESYSGRSLKQIDPLVRKILAIAIYQLAFLDRIPASAAVNEAVEQTRRFGRSKAAGFVNAVLRKAAGADLRKIIAAIPEPSIRLSHPMELIAKLMDVAGDDAIGICEHDNREAPRIVRLATDRVEALESPHVMITPHEMAGMFVVEGASKAVLARWANEGLAQVQDPTAASVVGHARIHAGDLVLDRCCGLGTKTMQLREKVGAAGRVIAMDPSAERCRGLCDLLARRGIENVDVVQKGMILEAKSEISDLKFKVALLDVPCSNSGVLARRPEARYSQTPAVLKSLAKLQQAILEDTAPHVEPGGQLIYSTCSIWPEENQQMIRAFADRHPEYAIETEQTTLPSLSPEPARYHDGGYVATMTRR